jgi:phosphoribosylglycinamide formyltransferase-1
MNIAVFVSGSGTNLQAIIDASQKGDLGATVALVVSDKEGAYALTRAKNASIETFVLNPKGFRSREEYDKEVMRALDKKHIELVVLAGFMRLVSDHFVGAYKNRIINIHPALLPSFKGTHGIRDAFVCGVKQTGVTVHFVDAELDHGPIILQEPVRVEEGDTLESLEEKIHKTEHRLYPEAIRLFAEGRLKIEGRKVKISR